MTQFNFNDLPSSFLNVEILTLNVIIYTEKECVCELQEYE